ncbi:MAG TPA: hypothetical protein VF658_13985 [Pyrinomonadaceae bacterium]|jgi:hypothetical protein
MKRSAPQRLFALLLGCVLSLFLAACSAQSGRDDTRLTIKRSYYTADENKPADMGTRDGDYSYFKKLESGGTAGFLYKTTPREEVYVLWDGQVIAGPLTTPQQIEEVVAELSSQMREEHETRTSIMNNWPTGNNQRYRVYDADGKLIREE